MGLNFGNILATSIVLGDSASYDTKEITQYAVDVLTQAGLLRGENKTLVSGNNKFHCPFHTDKTPSMYIHSEKGVYNCFSCQSSGSIHSLYKELTGNSLNKDLKIQFNEFTNYSRKVYEPEIIDYSKLPKTEPFDIVGEWLPIRDSGTAVRYLRKRGITFTVAEQMKMRYSEASRINTIIDNELYSMNYMERLVIPVYEQDTLISVEGRDLTGSSNKKVLYPKGSSVNTLFQLDQLDRTKPLYVMEGIMDLAVLRADPYFANSTCTFGNNITKRQLYLLQQFDMIYIPDADKAGERTISFLLDNFGKPFSILEVPKVQYLNDEGEYQFIKDVGDIPTKLNTTVESLRKRGWGRSLKKSSSIFRGSK